MNSKTTQIIVDCVIHFISVSFMYMVYAVRNGICIRYAVSSLDNTFAVRNATETSIVNFENQIFHLIFPRQLLRTVDAHFYFRIWMLYSSGCLTRKLQFPNKSNEFGENGTQKNSMHISEWWKII